MSGPTDRHLPEGGVGRRPNVVSIIVPVYNAERHLEACLASILAQTHHDIEVVLVDDGSTDGSPAICDRIARQDDRVVVVHRANGGIAAAQNSGLNVARGEYITFCDNDDLMSPHLVERLLQILREADADMSCCRWQSVGESIADRALRAGSGATQGEWIILDRPEHAYQSVFSLAHRILRRRQLHYFSEANWGKLYKAHLFENIRFPEGCFAQDVAVAMDLYRQMTRVASCSDALYVWVQHPHSVSHRVRQTRYFHDIVRAHGVSFDRALEDGIVPLRAYGGLMTLSLERASVRTDADERLYRADRAFVRSRLARLTWAQRSACWLMHRVRRAEVLVYRLTVHRRR